MLLRGPAGSVFVVVASLESLLAPKLRQFASLGTGTQLLATWDGCSSWSDFGKDQILSNRISFSTRVSTGMGFVGSEIRRALTA